MKVKDVMTATSLKFCSPETKLHNAAKTMKASNCGALPVVDKQKKVLGIVTDRDICLSLAQKQVKATVGQIMPTKVFTVKTDDDISTAFRQMRTNQIGRLPVIDEQGKLKGIVSLHNLINNTISNGKEDLGAISSDGENLLKTIQAVTDRYNGKISVKEKKTSTLKRSKTT